MKSNKIDLLIQYAILIAGMKDEYLSRQLGPIHSWMIYSNGSFGVASLRTASF